MENQKQTQTQKNRISELIESSLDSIRGIVDSGTVIGDPITTPAGTTIIPVSKVSVGFAGGGNDFTGRTGSDGKNNFSGGGGTGISVTPTAFIVVSATGSVELLSMANPTGATPTTTLGSSIDTLVDRAPDLIEKLKSVIGSKKKKKNADSGEVTIPDEAEAPGCGSKK